MKKKLKKIYKNFNYIQAVGIDGTSKSTYDKILNEEIDIIKRKISNNTYDFSYYKQKLIIKSMNKTREISIPTIRDKLVTRYLYENILNKFSDEIKQIPSLHTMIKDIKSSKDKFDCFLKVDIQNFFPTINHDILLSKLFDKFSEDTITLNLIKKAITQTTVSTDSPSKDRIKYNNKVGIPQGLSISGLLANIYLLDLDKKYKSNNSIKFYRFMDDILILCNKSDLNSLTKQLNNDFIELKLSIHDFKENSAKSSYGDINERFEFLGYAFHNDVISVRDISLQRMFTNISKLFTKYANDKYANKKEFYRMLNTKITGCVVKGKQYGWIYFFSFINDHQLLFSLDKFIENNCKKYDLKYKKVKRFSRAIFEVKNPDGGYLNNYERISPEILALLKSLNEDVEFY